MRLALTAALLLLGVSRANAEPPRPVVVELFTSQGCSSCPPADALLTELARNPNILPLAFHVTYWNNLGWRDPFSLEAATDRQRAYQRSLHTDTIYTPQMVIEGQADIVGSDRASVATAIAHATISDLGRARRERRPKPVRDQHRPQPGRARKLEGPGHLPIFACPHVGTRGRVAPGPQRPHSRRCHRRKAARSVRMSVLQNRAPQAVAPT
jgi:hypothetical protein